MGLSVEMGQSVEKWSKVKGWVLFLMGGAERKNEE